MVYSVQATDKEATDLNLKRADGAGERELLLSSGHLDHPTDWTRDGRYIVIERGQLGDQRIWLIPMLGEVYITSFPGGVGRWQVSTTGTIPAPVWRADGKELYFATLDGNLMVASIHESAASVTIEKVQPLFRSPFLTGIVRTIFDVDPKDGQRFIGAAAPDTGSLPLNVITNWATELEKK